MGNAAADPLARWVPKELATVTDLRRRIPQIAKDTRLTGIIEKAVGEIPTWAQMCQGDARSRARTAIREVHLVVTSPPYWKLKEYPANSGQLGRIGSYEGFLEEIEKVWRNCYEALVPGGRLVVVVGDVCLARRRNQGRHEVRHLHAAIQEQCRRIGYEGLATMIWSKIANVRHEGGSEGGGFLGKPYEPNAVVKNDIEFILMERKPGYRKPTRGARVLSVIPKDRHREWFKQVWQGPAGASTKRHPAPYPIEIPERLIRMFSFAGDTVLDPFAGTGTTLLAATRWGRNAIGVEIDPDYAGLAAKRLGADMQREGDRTAAKQGPEVIEGQQSLWR